VDAPRNIINPPQLRRLAGHVREVLGADVFVGIDQEGGRVARLTSARGFSDDPSAVEFAALPGAQQEQAARDQARQLADLGIDLNFAPCVDLDLEPSNPIIGGRDRSFGAVPEQVNACAARILHAHRAAGVAACLKHFPGHGSSRGDTHLGAVDITDSWRREAELAPYRALLPSPGVAVMVGHLLHRELDPTVPASLSRAVIQDLLRRDLGFAGVVITDSIDMHAIADHHSPAEAAIRAIDAGADLVVDGFNLDERDEHPAELLAEAIERAAADGRIEGGMARVEESAARLDALRREIGTPS
jgi:beta-N-acetylhexosaminidase